MAQQKRNWRIVLSKTGDKKAESNESRMDFLNDIEEKHGRNPDK